MIPQQICDILLIVICFGASYQTLSAAEPAALSQGELSALLDTVRRKHDIPGIAAAVVTGDGIQASAAVGVRKRDMQVPVTTKDLWHLGSNTKAMTAALVGRLVERELVDWNTTMAEIFPDLADGFHQDMRDVNILQLLSHRAGLPKDLSLRRYSRGGSLRALRLAAVKEYLGAEPLSKPGSTELYSNLAYIIVGAAIERILDKSWEDAITEEVFRPLEMNTAGFGGTGTPGELDQPWGHGDSGKPVRGNGPLVDNPAVMGPCGRVHASIEDWARFISDQLRGAQGKRGLLKPPTYEALRTPPFEGRYALGWMLVQRDWAGGDALTHTGSNTMNFSVAWLAPHRDFAVIVCTNQGGDEAFAACDETVAKLVGVSK